MRHLLALTVLLLVGCNVADVQTSDAFEDALDHADSRQMAGKNLICTPNMRSVCTSEGCHPVENQSYFRWTPSEERYERCDDTGCDAHSAVVSTSGIFTNITVRNGSVSTRIAEDGAFLETATLGMAVFVYGGQCALR